MSDGFQHLRGLKYNWDSYGGRPVTERSIQYAKIFLTKYKPEWIPSPQVFPTSIGGVNLEWDGIPFSVEVDLSTNGVIAFCFTRDSGSDALAEEYEEIFNRRDWAFGENIRIKNHIALLAENRNEK